MAAVSKFVNNHRPNLDNYIELYKHFHAHPELSLNESQTAAKIVSTLQSINSSLKITSGIGGHGLTAVHHNGSGPTILLRADIDALPVKELTGLPYASKAVMKDSSLPADHPDADKSKPLMHACGHDMHITSLLACAELLTCAADAWRGTVIYLFQPAEEKGSGARAMVADGLYEKIPVPDVVLGGHVMPFPAGRIGTTRGTAASSADSLAVTVYGRGGHASQPQNLLDPVVLASSIVLRLQTLVSREVNPADHAVCTVASLQAGDADNVVADEALLKVDLRAMNQDVRDRLAEGVRRIVKAECMASGCEKEPKFEVTRTFPLLVNGDEVMDRIENSFLDHFGDVDGYTGYAKDAAQLGGSEDFGELATAINKPSCFWTYGGTPHDLWASAEKAGRIREEIPINHSAKFAPQIMPTLQVAIDAYAVAALTWLAK
ncbi:metal-dependent amidase/aminoacylase/carboxypeptidase [Myriangium duriaei CBS 260.36]|uniref:Metal-dependent amidase/aminoacylase/carboxypeptidase n=1 Tax=Myriangium duriaei CBS 260.36 TaxID=1168546 RepID=A0A9P4J2A9_9PEZI|nr:metal-dependent amidase/aminoacylase/carboxypeptidase [Myriangium duriaei CBS 260.36]